MAQDKREYVAYRPFYISSNQIVHPGNVVQCTKLEAMCINTMQPMTLRKVSENDNRQGEISYHNEDI